MSHTPGPWTLHEGRNLHYVNARPDDYQHVAQRCYYIAGPAHDSDFVADVIVTALSPKGEANAQVMLAAPDLLEALEKIVAQWRNSADAAYSSDLCTDAVCAIRKARGE